jgi:hypothetical protein
VKVAVKPAEFDHIVFACRDLDQGAAFVQEKLGVPSQLGGVHVKMGTHNRLLSLGPSAFLELIAIDPNGAAPFQRRWFGLDDESLQHEIAKQPKLVHWVVRSPVVGDSANTDIEARTAAVREITGPVHPIQRGNFSWRITIPPHGTPMFGGVVPTVIQWDVPSPPYLSLVDQGVRLVSLNATVEPQNAAMVRSALSAQGSDHLIYLSVGRYERLSATLQVPTGSVVL